MHDILKLIMYIYDHKDVNANCTVINKTQVGRVIGIFVIGGAAAVGNVAGWCFNICCYLFCVVYCGLLW